MNKVSIPTKLITWLNKGDVAIQYQVHRDLLGVDKKGLQQQIAKNGWGARMLAKQNADGHWGRGFYQPKWISSHYTLLNLRNLCISPNNKAIRKTLDIILNENKAEDGGINPAKTIHKSDVCVSGMALNYFSYFGVAEEQLHSIVDFLLTEYMPDGGFNCESNHKGAVHSSLHSTLSVLEGIAEYQTNGYTYRLKELQNAQATAIEFILMHRLFRSDHTGQIINPSFLRLPYPCYWHYDFFRALDYFQYAEVPYDERMQEALDLLQKKRKADGRWPLQAAYPGQVHFTMEKTGQPSRWNTLRALRVIKHFSVAL